jgi:hypothetical protein
MVIRTKEFFECRLRSLSRGLRGEIILNVMSDEEIGVRSYDCIV